MKTEQRLIEKLEEYMHHSLIEHGYCHHCIKYESEITALKAEIEQQEPVPMNAEEILKRYWIWSIDNPETQKQCILQAMEEYASNEK